MKKQAAFAFLLNFIIALIPFGATALAHHGLFALTNDFNDQMIPFSYCINDLFHGAGDLWNMNIELGADSVRTFSFYGIASPFQWLLSLFPANAVMVLLGLLIYPLKYAVAGLGAWLYISCFLKEEHRGYALIGSVLYAFSGFQTVNLIFQFHDYTALFPFLLYGLERIIAEKKPDGFTVAVGFLAAVNFYLFFASGVYLAIYILIRLVLPSFYEKDPGAVGKLPAILRRMICKGLLGMGLAAPVLLPALSEVMQNPRINDHAFGRLLMSTRDYLRLVCALLLPGEPMTHQSYIHMDDFSSFSAFLPLFGIGLCLLFILRHRRHWLSHMLLTGFLCMAVPFLNNLFSGWTGSYHRWYFMPLLIMSLGISLTLSEQEERPAGLGIVFLISFLSIFLLASFMFLWDRFRYETIFRTDSFLRAVISTEAGFLILFVLFSLQKKQKRITGIPVLLLLTCIASVFYTSEMILDYQSVARRSPEELFHRIEACRSLSAEPGYRVLTEEDEQINLGIAAGLPVARTFISTGNTPTMRFYADLGQERKLFTPVGTEEINSLFGVRYLLSGKPHPELTLVADATHGTETLYLYEYPEYNSLACVPDDPDAFSDPSHLPVPIRSADSFHYDKNTVSCEIEGVSGEPLLFSIPYSPGFRAFINDRPVAVEDYHGLMLLSLTDGPNRIRLEYRSPSLYIRSCLFLLSILLQMLSLYINTNKRRHLNDD